MTVKKQGQVVLDHMAAQLAADVVLQDHFGIGCRLGFGAINAFFGDPNAWTIHASVQQLGVVQLTPLIYPARLARYSAGFSVKGGPRGR